MPVSGRSGAQSSVASTRRYMVFIMYSIYKYTHMHVYISEK